MHYYQKHATRQEVSDNSLVIYTRATDKRGICNGHKDDRFRDYEHPKQNIPFNQYTMKRLPAKTQPVDDDSDVWNMQKPSTTEHAKNTH